MVSVVLVAFYSPLVGQTSKLTSLPDHTPVMVHALLGAFEGDHP